MSDQEANGSRGRYSRGFLDSHATRNPTDNDNSQPSFVLSQMIMENQSNVGEFRRMS